MLQNPIGYVGKGNAYIYWKTSGEYFGYPSCCIENFLQRMDTPSLTESQEKVLDGMGFVPCDKCAKWLIRTKRQLKDLILPTRQHSAPFPEVNEAEWEAWQNEHTFLLKNTPYNENSTFHFQLLLCRCHDDLHCANLYLFQMQPCTAILQR